jgi:hypothetical protein
MAEVFLSAIYRRASDGRMRRQKQNGHIEEVWQRGGEWFTLINFGCILLLTVIPDLNFHKENDKIYLSISRGVDENRVFTTSQGGSALLVCCFLTDQINSLSYNISFGHTGSFHTEF